MNKSNSISKTVLASILIHIIVLAALFFTSDIKSFLNKSMIMPEEVVTEKIEVSYLESSKNPLTKQNKKNHTIKNKKENRNDDIPNVPANKEIPKESRVKKAFAKVDNTPLKKSADQNQLVDDSINSDQILAEETKDKVEDSKPQLIKNPNPPEEIDHTLVSKTAGPIANLGFDARKLEQMPGNPKPQYPKINRLKKQQGTVILKYLVTDDGKVNDLRVYQTSGHIGLDKEAIKKIKSWKFKPGQAGETFHPVIFKLKGKGEKLPTRLRLKKQS